jgi:hypothetical protein
MKRSLLQVYKLSIFQRLERLNIKWKRIITMAAHAIMEYVKPLVSNSFAGMA